MVIDVCFAFLHVHLALCAGREGLTVVSEWPPEPTENAVEIAPDDDDAAAAAAAVRGELVQVRGDGSCRYSPHERSGAC